MEESLEEEKKKQRLELIQKTKEFAGETKQTFLPKID
jgi:hypothetical protein